MSVIKKYHGTIQHEKKHEDDIQKEIEQMLRQRELQRQERQQQPVEQPRQTIKQEPPKTDTTFTDEDKRKTITNSLQRLKEKGGRLRRSEKKDLVNLEYDRTNKTRNIIIALAVGGLIFISMIRQYLPNEAMYAIIIIMGMMLFFPCGIIAGWLFLDPVMRCKILRRTSKRNYGIVGFVGKGLKAVLKIKNFDDGLIWRDKACWVITKDKITQITKDGNALTNTERTIDPESVITLVDTVPMIFVDLDSMEPLMLHTKGREPVYPLEIGATLKAWEDNQRAKMMQLRKAQDILLYIAIICAAGAIVIGFLNLQKIEGMATDMEVIKGMLYNMSRF